MGEAKRKEYRRNHLHRIEKEYGSDVAEYFFFLKERHLRTARNKYIITLWSQRSNKDIDDMYDECERLGLDLHPLTGDHRIPRNRYWQAITLLFDNQEDYTLFQMQFPNKVNHKFNFEEIYQSTLKK